MSFILDALKKLEHKQKSGEVPGLLTVQEGRVQSREGRKRHVWRYLFVAALLINAAVFVFVLIPLIEGNKNEGTVPSPVEVGEVKEKQGSVAQEPVPIEAVQPAVKEMKPASSPSASKRASPAETAISEKRGPERAEAQARGPLQEEGLPAISITGHIYSNEPSSRMVNINGHIIREGDTVSEGLKVEEITPEGVILDYEGKRISMRAF